jgi:6-phosphogluconate dehydrogenase (decarboxylating)
MQIGVIGLGRMGGNISRRLMKAGHHCVRRMLSIAAAMRSLASSWEQQRRRLYFLHRWPSQRSMQRIRQRVKQLTPRARCHADLRAIIADLNPVLRAGVNIFAPAMPTPVSFSSTPMSGGCFSLCA